MACLDVLALHSVEQIVSFLLRALTTWPDVRLPKKGPRTKPSRFRVTYTRDRKRATGGTQPHTSGEVHLAVLSTFIHTPNEVAYLFAR